MKYFKNILNIVKYNFKTLVRFEIIYKIVIALILLPLAVLSFNLTMKITGYSYLTLENIFGFILNPITLILLFLVVIFLTIITLFDITALITIFDESYHQKKINTADYGSKKILLVDDNKLNIKVARKTLEGYNFEIDECYDGQECLQKVVNGNEYDLILMDIMMPNMSGETAIAKLKGNPNFSIPTIALTADAVAGAEEKYLGEGFVDYIAKPFNKDQIKKKLDIVFKDNK